MHNVVIVAASRTPIGRFQGGLSSIRAPSLGAAVIQRLMNQLDLDPGSINEVIMGQVLTAGEGQNVARQTAIDSGLPVSVAATTINQVCGSGLKSVQLAARAIQCGDADIIIAGGQESMSLAPYVLPKARTGLRMGHASMIDSMIQDGLWDAFNDYHMGITAENLAEKWSVSREDQDAFALSSQQKAAHAIANGWFDQEITPVEVPSRKGEVHIVRHDEQPRHDLSLVDLAKLKPAFKHDGTVTAGNASSLNDGAAALVLMSEKKAAALSLPVLARIAGSANVGVDPATMGIGPVMATRACLSNLGWSLNELDLIEANEAFSVQALAVGSELGWNSSKVNVAGGAIALGHPIGASGARVLVTLIHQLERLKLKKGLATLCVGGGQGIAMAVER